MSQEIRTFNETKYKASQVPGRKTAVGLHHPARTMYFLSRVTVLSTYTLLTRIAIYLSMWMTDHIVCFAKKEKTLDLSESYLYGFDKIDCYDNIVVTK